MLSSDVNVRYNSFCPPDGADGPGSCPICLNKKQRRRKSAQWDGKISLLTGSLTRIEIACRLLEKCSQMYQKINNYNQIRYESLLIMPFYKII